MKKYTVFFPEKIWMRVCAVLVFFCSEISFSSHRQIDFHWWTKKIFFFINIDEEDVFMVFDLFTGGDLRYHLLQQVNLNNLFFLQRLPYLYHSFILTPIHSMHIHSISNTMEILKLNAYSVICHKIRITFNWYIN